jgi:hypothetical protein
MSLPYSLIEMSISLSMTWTGYTAYMDEVVNAMNYWSDKMKRSYKLQGGWWVTVEREGQPASSSENPCQDCKLLIQEQWAYTLRKNASSHGDSGLMLIFDTKVPAFWRNILPPFSDVL